jgi:glycosyltransferase involved in cell wall biosynthesis
MIVKGSGTTKILINALSARQGGGQTYLVNLLERLPDDFAAEIFILAPDSLATRLGKKNLTRIPTHWPLGNAVVRAIWERLWLPKLVARLDAKILFCPGGIIGSRVPPGCRTVTMFRNMIPFSDRQRQRYCLSYMRLRNFILKRELLSSMLRADLVIFLSNFAREVIEKEADHTLKRTVTIPHGISQSFRKTASTHRPPPAWLPAEGYFLYVSTLDYYKAQLEVVQAYAMLKKKRVTKEKLLLIGPEYPSYGKLVRRKISELNLEDDVIIAGAIAHSELPAVYQGAFANIFASECENCPNILMEALASGRPLFSSNCAPMPEFAGGAAVYFDPNSPDDLAEKLATVMADAALMTKLGEKAEKQSLLYDWASTAMMTWQSIRELTQS